MDLRDLRYFEVIAKLEHMGKAAAQLHRTQPALTVCIRRLEEEYGEELSLAVAGQAGVREVVRNHVAELDITMALAGHRSVAEIGRDSLRAVP